MDNEMLILWIDLTLAALALVILVTLSCVFSRDKARIDKKLDVLDNGLTACCLLIQQGNWAHVISFDDDRQNNAPINTSTVVMRGNPSTVDAVGTHKSASTKDIYETSEFPTLVDAKAVVEDPTDVNDEKDGDVTIKINVEGSPGDMGNQSNGETCSGNGDTQL